MNLDPRLQSAAKLHIPDALFVTVSGAHLYGFSSPDSDYDLRGSHVAPLRELVGLFPPRETLEVAEIRDGLEWDIVSHEIRKFCALIGKDSGYALEQLCSPLIVVTSPAHEELKAIALESLNRKFARHYLGFAENQWRLFLKDSPPRVETFALYLSRAFDGRSSIANREIRSQFAASERRVRQPDDYRFDRFETQRRRTPNSGKRRLTVLRSAI